MYRALFLLGGFSVASPTIRGYLFHSFDLFSIQVTKHATIAGIAAGVLCFASFLYIQLTSKQH
jgi:hypothetical protein